MNEIFSLLGKSFAEIGKSASNGKVTFTILTLLLIASEIIMLVSSLSLLALIVMYFIDGN